LLLYVLLKRADRRAVINDLSELYGRRLELHGEVAARAWLRRQLITYPRRLMVERLRRMFPGKGGNGAVRSAGSARASVIYSLVRDLRHSARSLARSPMIAATIVLTVGLGIGATAAIFSAVNAVLIQPLPYSNPDELVRIFTESPPHRWPISVADYRALEEQQTSFVSIAGYDNSTVTFNRGDVAERVSGKFVTWDYFSLLGVTPFRGRVFNESDGKPESKATVVISHSFWSRHLGGDVRALGQSIQLDGNDYMVVGILPRTVGPFEQGRDFFVAVEWQHPPRRGPFFITAIARVNAGTDRSVASEELRAINKRIFPVWQDSYQDQGASWGMMDLKDVVVGDVGTTEMLVLGAVVFLLLIASNNAANLLLARTTQRSRELVVRAALGASRGRLMQHMLSESALLALGGALVGVFVMYGGIRLLTTTGADFIPRAQEIGVDERVLLFLAVVTLISGLLFGLIPSLTGVKLRLERALRVGGRSATDAAGPRRIRRVLVASQFAIATPLLIGAGLLISSLARLQNVDPGFDTDNILVAGLSLPETAYPERDDVQAFWPQVVDRVEALPGVESVVLGDALPPTRVNMINNFNLEDKPTAPGQSEPATPWVAVTLGYFTALGIDVVEGRPFNELDHGDAPPVVVVDQAWANRFFPDESVVGKRFVSGGCTTCPLSTIVGVVSDVKYVGLDDPGTGTVYWPMSQGTKRFVFLLVKTHSDPMVVLPTLKNAVRELDSSLPLSNVTTIDESIANSLQAPRYLTALAAAFAVVALLLSVIGVYGVMSHHVQQHTKDIGIRIALGGGPSKVLGSVVWQGLRLALVGVALGTAGTFYLTRFMASMLFGVGTMDVITFCSVAAVMLGVALVACLLPAHRAASVDPVSTLREE
jgi:putative ABC transport system permease protein